MAFKPKDRIAWTIAFPGSTEFEVRFGVVESLSTKGRINVKFDDGRRARIDGAECAKQMPGEVSLKEAQDAPEPEILDSSTIFAWNASQGTRRPSGADITGRIPTPNAKPSNLDAKFD